MADDYADDVIKVRATIHPQRIALPGDAFEGRHCACGSPAMHYSDGSWVCCRCYVTAGEAPADWHPQCMETYHERGLRERESMP